MAVFTGNRYEYETPYGSYVILEQPGEWKTCRGPGYNWNFNVKTGEFARWGNTEEEDPIGAPIGPEILDLEISTNGCTGASGTACKFCYKSNTNAKPTNMTLDTFKLLLSKFNAGLTQIAFGITGLTTNPDFIPMMKHARSMGVVPNFTTTGRDLTDEMASEIAKYAGGLAVSFYPGEIELGLKTIKKFHDVGIKQTNVHLLLSNETLPHVKEVLSQYVNRCSDERWDYVNAFVFLSAKPKGRAKGAYTAISTDDFAKLTQWLLMFGVPFGFDSCSAPKFDKAILRAMEEVGPEDQMFQKELSGMLQCSERCESGLFSSYIDVEGRFWPCSFAENEEGVHPINVLECSSFYDVWEHNEHLQAWRERLLGNDRECPLFPEINS